MGISYREEKTADFVWLRTGPLFALVGGCREREISGRVCAATNVAAIDFITYNFTEITITTPPLTRILDRLIKGGTAYVAMAYNIARSGRHNTKNNLLAL